MSIHHQNTLNNRNCQAGEFGLERIRNNKRFIKSKRGIVQWRQNSSAVVLHNALSFLNRLHPFTAQVASKIPDAVFWKEIFHDATAGESGLSVAAYRYRTPYRGHFNCRVLCTTGAKPVALSTPSVQVIPADYASPSSQRVAIIREIKYQDWSWQRWWGIILLTSQCVPLGPLGSQISRESYILSIERGMLRSWGIGTM